MFINTMVVLTDIENRSKYTSIIIFQVQFSLRVVMLLKDFL
jgi:hypothetical protein